MAEVVVRDGGELHRVAVVSQNATLLQEIPLFSPPEPLTNLLLYQGRVLVGGSRSLALVPAQGCSLFHSCQVCARARGLGCEWISSQSSCMSTRDLPQAGDMVDQALRRCDAQEGRCSPALTDLRVVLGLRVLLPCLQLSPRPCSWDHPPHRLTRQHHSHLELTVTEESLGTYVCTCQEAGNGVSETTPCRRAAYHLTLDEPTAGGAVALGGGRHVMAIYILVFVGGALCGGLLLFLATRGPRNTSSRQQQHLSEKGRELLGSSATPQSPSSTSLFSEGFHLTEKHNGTAPSTTTTTTLLSHHSNGTHHITNGNGNAIYAHCNSNDSRLRLDSGPSPTAETVDSRESGERDGAKLEGAIMDALTDGLDMELSMPMFKPNAPLAKCEESSI
uniref:Semaphorin 4F C-terminal domain-containing protein n=1 Tax=Knipowitschia caucasica TaxID=637954 RepID=A0AAV2KPH2_KNICA